MSTPQQQTRRSLGRAQILTGLVIFLVAFAAVLSGRMIFRSTPGMDQPDADVSSYLPRSLTELVAGWPDHPNDVIVVARVGSYSVKYDPIPTPIASDVPPEPTAGHTEFELIPERVLLDDGSGRPLVLARDGFPEAHPDFDEPYEKPGDRYLYFLEYDPEGGETGAYTLNWERLDIEGDTVMWALPTPQPVPFATGTPPAAFLDAVATAIATIYPTPRP